MAGLIPRVVALFHHPATPRPHSGLGEGGEEFLQALIATQEVQRDIQGALVVLTRGAGLSAADAYVALCEFAEDARGSLHDVAIELLSRARAEGDLELVVTREISSWWLLRPRIDSRVNSRLSVRGCGPRVPPIAPGRDAGPFG